MTRVREIEDEQGSTMVEVALVVALIALLALPSLSNLGNKVADTMCSATGEGIIQQSGYAWNGSECKKSGLGL